jgi:hypothetical protein
MQHGYNSKFQTLDGEREREFKNLMLFYFCNENEYLQ